MIFKFSVICLAVRASLCSDTPWWFLYSQYDICMDCNCLLTLLYSSCGEKLPSSYALKKPHTVNSDKSKFPKNSHHGSKSGRHISFSDNILFLPFSSNFVVNQLFVSKWRRWLNRMPSNRIFYWILITFRIRRISIFPHASDLL